MGIFNEINNMIDRWTGNDRKKNAQQGKSEKGIYVGYDNGNISISTPTYGIHADKFNGYNYGNVGRSNTTAYKANAAGTANKIAQGGMTKDDILKYNEIHPNEIAGDKPANTTALNTNTALRS